MSKKRLSRAARLLAAAGALGLAGQAATAGPADGPDLNAPAGANVVRPVAQDAQSAPQPRRRFFGWLFRRNEPPAPNSYNQNANPPQASKAPPTTSTPPASGSYSTTGRMVFDEPPLAPPLDKPAKGAPFKVTPPASSAPAPAPAPTPVAASPTTSALQARVRQACAGLVGDVQITTEASGMTMVKVRVTEARNQDEVIKRVFAIPELQTDKVRLSLDVGP